MDKLKVSIPKFSIRGSLELNEPLAALNISRLFGSQSNLTGFIDLESTPTDQVDQVPHEFKLWNKTHVYLRCGWSLLSTRRSLRWPRRAVKPLQPPHCLGMSFLFILSLSQSHIQASNTFPWYNLILNVFSFRSARPLIHTKFTANHPFLFLIYDKQVGEKEPLLIFISLIQVDVILFFGVYQHPPTP